nr:replication initiator [Actinoplanes lichenis]
MWWPATTTLRYPLDRLPVFDAEAEAWLDPDTRTPLPTWDKSLDAVDADPDARPAHVVRFGPQVKAKGVDPGAQDVSRTIGYIIKYVTKSAADCHSITSDP